MSSSTTCFLKRRFFGKTREKWLVIRIFLFSIYFTLNIGSNILQLIHDLIHKCSTRLLYKYTYLRLRFYSCIHFLQNINLYVNTHIAMTSKTYSIYIYIIIHFTFYNNPMRNKHCGWATYSCIISLTYLSTIYYG